MSFRRTLSAHERLVRNVPFSLFSSPMQGVSPMASPTSNAFSTPVTSSPQSETISRFSCLLFSASLPFSWLKASHQGTSERPKPQGYFMRKLLLHIFICFFLGFGMGLTPFRHYDLLSSTTITFGVRLERTEDLSIEWKGLATSLQRQANKFTGREQQTFTKEAENIGFLRNQSATTDIGDESLSSRMMEIPVIHGSEVQQKLLIVVTPTYTRPFQAMYLTRLAHTLKLVPPPLLWLVVETPVQSLETAALLRNTGVMYRHLVCTQNRSNIREQCIYQRNIALAHIERHQLEGIVHFADDDNVYTLELFKQLREIERFGTWPVGMLAHSKSRTTLEGPVCKRNTVIGWHTDEKDKRSRRFHADISGFGFNSSLLWDSQPWHRPTQESMKRMDIIKEGYQETSLIERLVEDESQMEGLPSGCSRVMVWHLHLEAQGSTYPSGWTSKRNLEPTFH